MTGEIWLWIALAAFLIFCCLPMLILHSSKRDPQKAQNEDVGSGKER